MSVESDFEDTVRICEFYADPCEAFEVDFEKGFIFMGAREINLVMEDGRFDGWLVIEPDGVGHLVDDLDSYFQGVFDWRRRS